MSYKEKLKSHNETLFGITLYGTILNKETKISVHRILWVLSEGKSTDDIIKAHPEISISDIYACLEYAAELTNAIDFKEATLAISTHEQKRDALADKILSAKGKPPPGWPE